MISGVAVWASAYLVAFGLGAVLIEWFERQGSAGFAGALFGWAVGGAVGALVSASSRARVGRLCVAAAWGLSFFVGGYVSVIAGMFLGEEAKVVLGFLGWRAALSIGWGLGGALGGAMASALGMAALDAIAGPGSEAAI